MADASELPDFSIPTVSFSRLQPVCAVAAESKAGALGQRMAADRWRTTRGRAKTALFLLSCSDPKERILNLSGIRRELVKKLQMPIAGCSVQSDTAQLERVGIGARSRLLPIDLKVVDITSPPQSNQLNRQR